MKKFTITVTNNLTANTESFNAKSEANMWNVLRNIRNGLTKEAIEAGVRAIVTDEEGRTFKDITFRMNSKGKIEMPNAVKETNRKREKKSDAAQTIEALADELCCNSDESNVNADATEFDPEKLQKVG